MDRTTIKVMQEILQSEFKLTGKVNIILVPRIRIWGNPNAEAWGFYYDLRGAKAKENKTPWKFKHCIKLGIKGITEKQAFTILAHEYAHAWQTERFWFYDKRRMIDNNGLEHSAAAYFAQWVPYFKEKYGIDIINM